MKARAILLMFIWISWIGFLVGLNSTNISEEKVIQLSGTVREAFCITSRSVSGIELKVSLGEGELITKFVNLPGEYECKNDLVTEFRGKTIQLYQHEERNVGLSVGGTVILDVEEGVDRAKNKTSSIVFSFFLALVASILVLIRKK